MKNVFIFSLGCLVSFLFFVIVAYFSLPLSSPALQHYYTIKDHINASTPKDKKRLVIMSASDGMFGIVGKMIDKETQYYPINYSMFFGTGLDIEFRINKLLSILQDGDTLLLPLNYAFYTSTYNPQYFSYYQNLLSWGDKNFFINHPILSLKTILKSPPSKIPAGLLSQIKAKIQGRQILQEMQSRWKNPSKTFDGIKATSLDPYGELYNHQGTILQTNTTAKYISDDFQVSSYFLSQYKKLSDFCNQHNIKILFTYSPTLKNPSFDLSNPKDFQRLNKLKKELKKHNIILLGNPQNFQFTIQDFYDTAEHLNTQGAIKYTKELIKILNQS